MWIVQAIHTAHREMGLVYTETTYVFTYMRVERYTHAGSVYIIMYAIVFFDAVYVPSVIQNQMVFSQFTMLKMFLSAVIAGMWCLSKKYL